MALKIQYNAPVTLSFSLICIFIYILCSAFPSLSIHIFSLRPYWDASNPVDYISLFTYTMGHANIEHLTGNMSMFLLIAPMMEEKYGSKNIAIMMAVTALITAILQLVFFSTGLIGASGILFMFIILTSFADAKKGSIPLTFILVLVFFLGREVSNAFLSTDNVSQYAHIIGGIFGAIFGFVLGKEPSKSTKSVEY